jgi:hypothetical protein
MSARQEFGFWKPHGTNPVSKYVPPSAGQESICQKFIIHMARWIEGLFN